MTQAAYYCCGEIFADASPVCMARVVDYDSQVITASQVDTASYSICELKEEHGQRVLIPVTGQTNVSLWVPNVFYNELQTSAAWMADSQGFNFRHILDNSAGTLFPKPLSRYLVKYRFQMKDNTPPIFIEFLILTK